MAEQNQLVSQSALSKYANIYDNSVAKMAENSGLQLSKSQKLNVTIGAQQIYTLCVNNNLLPSQLDHSNVSKVLFQIAMLDLNPNAVPRECYFIIRKGSDESKSTIEYGIEGDGNDALLRKYGVDLKSLSAPYIVREGDDFTYPYFDGEKMVPPVWKMKSLSAKPILVFYILTKQDGTKEYLMADREGVANNLKAHIINNLQGVKDEIKDSIIAKIDNMSLDQLLSDTSIRTCKAMYKSKNGEWKEYEKTLISPAWLNPHARESMIIRKMRNNCTKKYPKNFDSAFIQEAYEDSFEDKAANDNTFTPDPNAIVADEVEKESMTKETKSVFKSDEKNDAKLDALANENGEIKQDIKAVEMKTADAPETSNTRRKASF